MNRVTLWPITTMGVESNDLRHRRSVSIILMSAVLVLAAQVSFMAFPHPMGSSITGQKRSQSKFLMQRQAIGLLQQQHQQRQHQQRQQPQRRQQRQAMPSLAGILQINAEEDLAQFIKGKMDFVVKLGFTWCRPCKAFLPHYTKLAKIYGETQFLKVTCNENEWSKRYSRDVLQISESPTFAAYSGGELVAVWTGGNAETFIRKLEKTLPSAAGKFKQATLAAGCK